MRGEKCGGAPGAPGSEEVGGVVCSSSTLLLCSLVPFRVLFSPASMLKINDILNPVLPIIRQFPEIRRLNPCLQLGNFG